MKKNNFFNKILDLVELYRTNGGEVGIVSNGDMIADYALSSEGYDTICVYVPISLMEDDTMANEIDLVFKDNVDKYRFYREEGDRLVFEFFY